jgi:hypothetical protein
MVFLDKVYKCEEESQQKAGWMESSGQKGGVAAENTAE